jgi:hypothetical protein
MGTRFKGDTKDPAVNVTTWVLLVTIILSVSVRLGTKWRLFHKLTADDVLIVTSMVGFARGDLWGAMIQYTNEGTTGIRHRSEYYGQPCSRIRLWETFQRSTQRSI